VDSVIVMNPQDIFCCICYTCVSEKRKVKSEKSKCFVVMQNFVGNCCRKTARIMFCRICHKLSEERRVKSEKSKCFVVMQLRNNKSNVLSDMLSDSIKYKDLRSEKHTYKLAIGSKRIENPYT
jgi:hypothetical protein